MQEPKRKSQSMGRVVASVLASMFGVQSNRTREHDFRHGKASHYIVIGLVATLVFILTVWGIVQLVLKAATS